MSKKLSSLGLLVVVVVGLLLFNRHHPRQQVFAPDPGATSAYTPPSNASLAEPPPMQGAGDVDDPAFLPAEAKRTLALIAQGGPFPHRQDGVVFQNREHRLPSRPNGYYHEYTVETPGADNRGTRRIIIGGTPPSEYWYSGDHYETFRKFTPNGAAR